MNAPAQPVDDSLPTPGSVVGNRFEVLGLECQDALGWVLGARDQRTESPVFLRVLRPEWIDEATLGELRSAARTASELTHKTILTTYGVGTTDRGLAYVATEAVDGRPLLDVLREHASSAKPVSLAGALNVIANVCRALSHAQDRLPHGTLRPSVVWIGRNGRVKVGDFGVGRALVARHGAAVLGSDGTNVLAPEVKAGRDPDARSDVYGLGAMLYELLTSRSIGDGFVSPAQVARDVPADLDHLLLRCVATAPEGRIGSADELRTALLPFLAKAKPAASREDFGVEGDVVLELDLELVAPPTDPAIDLARSTQSLPPPEDAPRVSRVSPAPTAPRTDMSQQAARASTVDIATALKRITTNDAPRWMAEIDGIDHGPFSGREVVDRLAKGEITLDHRVHNMDTNARTLVRELPDFAAFGHQFEREQADKAHKASVHAAAASDHVSSRRKVAIASAVLVTTLGAGGYFLFTRQRAQQRAAHEQEVTALFDIGRIQATASGDILPDPALAAARRGGPRPHGTGGSHPGAPAGAGGGGGAAPTGEAPAPSGGHGNSFEDAMNRVVDFGDLSGGAMTQLTASQVGEVMGRHLGRIYSACVPAEQARGGSLGRVQIDMAIAGDGHVLGASSRQGSPEFRSCISRQVTSIHFPTFNSPRMAARYSFDGG